MINFFIESAIAMSIFYTVYLLILKHETAHQFIRGYLLISLVLCIILPVLDFPVLALPGESVRPYLIVMPEIFLNPAQAANGVSTVSWYFLIYLTVSSIFSAVLLYKIWSIMQLRRNAHYSYYQGYRVIHLPGKDVAFSFLNTIYLGADKQLTPEKREQILRHELVHIKERHSLDVLLVEVLRIVFWFNPIIYWYHRSLVNTHEYLADAGILKQVNRKVYIQLLTEQTLKNLGLSLGNHFGSPPQILRSGIKYKSQILKRIKMMKSNRKMHKLKYFMPAFALMAVIAVVSCENNDRPSDLVLAPIEGEIHETVDETPVFGSGMSDMTGYLTEHIKYPKEALEKGVGGKLFVKFVVDKEGHVHNAKVIGSKLNSTDPHELVVDLLTNEAIRVVTTMPKWTPGKLAGEPVNTQLVLPIVFKLD